MASPSRLFSSSRRSSSFSRRIRPLSLVCQPHFFVRSVSTTKQNTNIFVQQSKSLATSGRRSPSFPRCIRPLACLSPAYCFQFPRGIKHRQRPSRPISLYCRSAVPITHPTNLHTSYEASHHRPCFRSFGGSLFCDGTCVRSRFRLIVDASQERSFVCAHLTIKISNNPSTCVRTYLVLRLSQLFPTLCRPRRKRAQAKVVSPVWTFPPGSRCCSMVVDVHRATILKS